MDLGLEVAIGYGPPGKPDFWISVFNSGEGFRESHVAFAAPDRAAVRAFFDAAVATGAEVLHEPRVWPEYHPTYYGAFVRDPTATTSRPSATPRSRSSLLVRIQPGPRRDAGAGPGAEPDRRSAGREPAPAPSVAPIAATLIPGYRAAWPNARSWSSSACTTPTAAWSAS
jgi:hypothetical protein